MKTYIDDLKTRNKVEYDNEKYVAYSYDDFFMGEWIGNINIFDGQQDLSAVLINGTVLRQVRGGLFHFFFRHNAPLLKY